MRMKSHPYREFHILLVFLYNLLYEWVSYINVHTFSNMLYFAPNYTYVVKFFVLLFVSHKSFIPYPYGCYNT